MIIINWDEFKEFKKDRHSQNDNFSELLEFIKRYYCIFNPSDIFNILKNDELAEMMLNKRNIENAEDLESYLFKII